MSLRRRPVAALLWALCLVVPPACATPATDIPSAAPPTNLVTTSSPPSPPSGRGAASPADTSNANAEGAQVVGFSTQGRPILLRSVGHGPRRVLFIGAIHGDEPEGAHTAAALPEAFTAAGLADRITLSLVEDANPDGRALGTRGNANGVDINRNFPASNFDASDPANGGTPLSQAESRVLFDTIERLSPDLIISMHSWSGREFINFDGPGGALAQRFAQTSGLPVEESNAFAPTPGSLGSFIGRDSGTALLTVEVVKGSDPVAVWNQLKTALIQAIKGDV